jgi:hypothetical protein
MDRRPPACPQRWYGLSLQESQGMDRFKRRHIADAEARAENSFRPKGTHGSIFIVGHHQQ